jgi:carbamoyl-phosphate synthase large subunit
LVIKPRWGTASIGIHYSEDDTELALAHRLAQKQVERSIIAEVSAQDPGRCGIVQEFLRGEEYGLDVINDLEGRYVTTLVRRKLGMRAGETDRAVTCHDRELEALGERIGRNLGHVGNLDCDVIRGPGSVGILDMNPRFGGGYPFVHLAGANLPAALLAWAAGQKPDSAWLRCRAGVMSCKYDSLLVVPDSSQSAC